MKEQLAIKGLKTWTTYDGGGYQFNLYRNNKKVAFVHEAGVGGCLDIDWSDVQAKADIEAYVKTLPKIEMKDRPEGCEPVVLDASVDLFMEELVTAYEWEKKLSRYRKQNTLFRLLNDPEYSFRPLKTLDLTKAKEFLDKKYPNQYTFV